MAELDNSLDAALEEIERASIKTSQGSFIRVEEVRRLLKERQTAKAVEEEEAPAPKDMNQAKQMAKRDPEIAAAFANRKPDAGKSIGADA